MNALTLMLAETPNTIDGLRGRVAEPMDVWLDARNGEMPIRGRLLQPLREKAIEPANQMAGAIRTTETAYHDQVLEPVKAAQKHQRAVREQIDAYRKKYEL